MSSDGATSPSTESASAYAPQSITDPKSKIKEALSVKVNEDFSKNPIFQDSNPNAKRNKEIYINHLASKGYDKKQLQNISEGVDDRTKFMPDFERPYGSLQPIVDFSVNMVTGAAQGVNAGLEKFNQGIGTVVNALGGQTGGFTDKAEELTKGGLESATGLGETALAGASVAVPEMAAFVASTSAIKEAASALPDHEAKFVNDVVDFPFAAVSKTAQALGFNPEKHENWAMLMEVADFAAIAKGIQVYGKKTNPIQSVKDLNTLSDKAVKGEMSPEEMIKYQEFADKTKDITLEEIREVAEEKGSSELVKKIDENIEYVKKEREKRGLPTETYVDDLPESVLNTIDLIDKGAPVDVSVLEESSKALYDKYKFLKEEKENPNRIQTIEEINNIQEKIGEDISYIEDYKNRMIEGDIPLNELSKKVEDLSTEMNNENVSPEMKAKFQEEIQAAESEINNINAIKDQKISDIANSEIADANNEVMLEIKKEDLKNATTETGKDLIQKEIDALEPLVNNSKTKPERKISKKTDYTKGKRAEDVAAEQGVEFSSPEHAQQFILENSENPAEIATEYMNMEADGEISYKSQQLEDYGIKMTDEEFNQNFDKNKKNFTLAKKYIDNKRKVPLDVQLMELSERAGIEITEQDLFDHIDKMELDRASGKESSSKTKFKSKFYELTGKELTPALAREIIKDEINQNIENYEQYITRENLTAEAEEQLYYEGLRDGTIPTFDSERYGNVPRDKKVSKGAKKIEQAVVEAEKPISKKVNPVEDKLPDLGNNDATPKTQKLAERMELSSVVNKEIKQGLLDKGTEYIPLNIDISKADAKQYVEAMDKAGELDKAIANVTNMLKSDPKNLNERFNRGLISAELFEKLADKSNNAKTDAQKTLYRDLAVDLAKFAADSFTSAGKELNAAKVWKRMMERTPDGVVQSIRESYAEQNKPVLDSLKGDIKDAKKVIDEFLESKDFKDLVGKKVKEELVKLGKKSEGKSIPKDANIFNSKAVRESRKTELMAKWKAAKGSASSSIVGLNKEQIEVAGEMALIHIVEGVVKAADLAVKLRSSLGLTPEQFKDLWENVDVAGKKIKEYAEEKAKDKFDEKTIQKAIDVFSGKEIDKLEEKAYRDAVKQQLSDPKSELYKKLTEKLSNVKPENRKKILGDILAEVEKVGGLSDKRFQEIYGEAFGLKTLSGAEEVKIRALIDTINKAEKTGAELSKTILGGGTKEQIKQKRSEWEKAVFEAQKANNEVSQYFKADKRIGNTISSFIQAGLLTSMSLLKNVYSNTLMIPTRSTRRGIASAADYLISKATNTPRTIDALAYWKGAMQGVRPGVEVAFKELLGGVNPEQMTERDYNQTLEPLKAMYSFVNGLKGKEKIAAYDQVNNFMEGTFGLSAELMFRLLNLGDKPNRVAAEFGAAFEIGKLKGLKGKELDNFVLFPDEISAKEIKLQGERAVFQQTEGLTGEVSKGLKKLEDVISNKIFPQIPLVGDVLKVLWKTQMPYKKTPLNILGETFKLVLPEVSVAEGLYHALKTGDRKKALESFSNAAIGFGIREGVKALMANNLVTGSGDYRDKEGNMIQQQNVAPSSINISGMQRMFSGGTPATKDGDTWINYSNMGPIGIFLGVHSQLKDVPDEARSYLMDLATVVPATGQYALEQSFLLGMNNFLTAMGDKEGRSRRKWALNTLGTVGSAFYPNSVATVSKAADENVRELKDEKFSTELVNTFKSKMFMGDGLPSKVNLWGEKITGAPEGRSKMLWYLMDVTKFKNVPTESYNYKVFQLWNNVEDTKLKNGVLPNVPQQKITVKGESVKLTPQQYEKYQIYTGKNRAALVRDYAESPNWEKDSDEKKVERLKGLYSDGLSNAKRQLFKEYPELKKKK